MKTIKWFALVASLAVPLLSGNAQTSEAAAPGASGPAQVAIPASLSPGAAEVVRLATSGVSDDVVLAYIQNTQAPFNLGADDVLYLKDIGLSAEVTSAMLNHDSKLRNEPQQYAPAATTPAATAATQALPAAPVSAATPVVAAAPAPVYVSSPPADVAYFYNDLAPYGTWVQLDGYGWCWQPTAVVVTRGWRPYCDGGYWVYSDLGWYWHSTYSWGWAPFHYGRWHMHPRCGWVWMPDRVWGPAWVTWRTTGNYCGWAPLPPHATFDVRLGWCYNGVRVGASFGFNLGSDAFLFVSFGDFCSRDLHRRCLPPPRVPPVYRQTTIINNYVVNNNRIVHRGVPIERVSGASRDKVPRATVRDWSSRPSQIPTRAGSVVYRPRLEAPTKPGRMEAQKLDAQNPVIRHAPSGPHRLERTAAAGRGGQASSARPEASRQIQSAPSTAQSARATPAGRAPRTSDWSGSATPKSSAQPQVTQARPQPVVTPPSGRAPLTSDWSGGAKTKPSARVQTTPSPAQSAPASSAAPAPTPQVQLAPVAPQSVPTIPPAARTPRAPENWKQGTRAAPGYRSDAGLPALGNAREAAEASSAVSSTRSGGRTTPLYVPKSQQQANEIRSVGPSSQRPTPSPASQPRGDRPTSRSPKGKQDQ